MKKLNIGSGAEWKVHEGFAGMDKHDFGQKYVADILGPGGIKQFKDNTLDEVMAKHFLEHLTQEDLKSVLNQVHRILKKNGIFKVCVPHINSERAYVPDHKTFWTESTFKWLEEEDVWEVYGFKKWKIEELVVNDRRDIHCRMIPIK